MVPHGRLAAAETRGVLASAKNRLRLCSPLAAWLVALALAAAQGYAALRRPLDDRLSDLHVYTGAVRLLRDGGSLYDFVGHNDAPFTYPPFAGLLFVPLSLLDEAVLRVLWTALTIAAVCGLAVLTARHAALPRRLPVSAGAGLVAACLFASAPVSSNIRYGQVSVFLALLILVDLTRTGRLAGAWTGLAAAVKLTPLLFLPFLYLAGRRRAALTGLGTVLGGTALAWAALPSDSRRYWLTEVWDVNRVGHITTGGNQSLNGALLRLAVPDGARTALVALGALAVAVLAFRRAVRAARTGEWFTAAVVVGAASVVISPVSWTHHLVWLVLAALLPLPGPAWHRLVWTVTAGLVMVAPVTSLDRVLPGLLGQLAADTRLLLAIAVACLVPFGPRPIRESGPEQRVTAPAPAPR
ncbi:MAG TPA: glycosyltransferase 87 family protein [Rugosimonospora sp.]|nr:glycosyltransferase 87 family protein [Rugosimonospora sp.]